MKKYYYDYLDGNYNRIFGARICHKITEIYHNFFLCNENQILNALENGKHFDVLVPLNSLDGQVWDYIDPKKTKIFYFPCPDYGILPINCLDYLVTSIIKFLKERKKVALFCMGGHGRTGYIASCVLGKLKVLNPIEVIKKKYCENAIETISQFNSIEEYLGINCYKYTYPMRMNEFKEWMISNIIKLYNEKDKKKEGDNKSQQYNYKYYTQSKYSYLYNLTIDELIALCYVLKIQIPTKFSELVISMIE